MAIKAGFGLNPFPPILESEGGGGRGAYLILWPSAAEGWRLLECGRLFGEIRYILTTLAERVFLESVQLC